MRPMLVPGLRWAWRTHDTVQFGVDVPNPLLVTGLPPFAHTLLPLLDGTHTIDELITALAVSRPEQPAATPAAVRGIVERLHQLSVLIEGGRWPGGRGLRPGALPRLLPDHRVASSLPRFRQDAASRLDRLAASRIVVEGLSRLGAVMWTSLTAAGVARVDARDSRPVTPADVCVGGFSPAEIGQPRSALPGLHGAWVTRTAPRYAATVLHVLTDAVDVAARSQQLTARGTPHLVVTCRERIGRVGPLTLPGQTPCPNCLTLAHRDRDPGWVQVWRQLGSCPSPDTDASLVGMTAHLATAHVLDWLTGGRPTTLAGQIELTAPDGVTRVIPAAQHPECGCAWPDVVA